MMKNSLKVKTIISCFTCGCPLKRSKTIKVLSSDQCAAKEEARQKIDAWRLSIQESNCKVCDSIINDLF
jgi:hypothetical protein